MYLFILKKEKKPHFEEVKGKLDKLDANIAEEEEYIGLVYPKFEMILEYNF